MREKAAFIDAGRIINTHGVHGEVKIEVWLDSPETMMGYPRFFLAGKELRLLSAYQHKNFVIAHIEGVEDMNTAMTLKGRVLQIARDDAQLPQGAYFLQDLLGAVVTEENGSVVGVLEEILERPASDIYVIRGEDGKEHLIPAVPAFVLTVDPDEPRITVRLIEGM